MYLFPWYNLPGNFFLSFYSLFLLFISVEMVNIIIIRSEDLDLRRKRFLTTRERLLVLPLTLLRSWPHPCVFPASQSPELAVREMQEHAFHSSCTDSYILGIKEENLRCSWKMWTYGMMPGRLGYLLSYQAGWSCYPGPHRCLWYSLGKRLR